MRYILLSLLCLFTSNAYADLYVYNFTAGWCPGCVTMKREWKTPQVKTKLKKFHAQDKYDFDWDDERLRKYYDYYGVTSIPTTIIVDETGKEIKRKQVMGQQELLEFLTVGDE